MWELKDLIEWCEQNLKATETGEWVPARHVRFCSFWERLCHAWNVFIGKEDSFVWPDGQ